MKRSMVCLIALCALCAALLSGCGENETNPPKTTPTTAPQATIQPETMVPDVSDGVVNDTDGVITGNDDGDTATGGSAAGSTGGVGNTETGTTGGTGAGNVKVGTNNFEQGNKTGAQ